jgi:hypothetical protein
VALLLSVVSLLPPSRLIEVLLDTLSLSAPITPLTRELGGSSGGAKMQLVFIPKRGLTEKGIDSVPRSADPIQLSLSVTDSLCLIFAAAGSSPMKRRSFVSTTS